MIKLSAIIPTYNRCSYLEKSILSLQNQNYPRDEFEIIVVDNNSSDDTAAVVEKCRQMHPKEVIFIKEHRQGLHNARHKGAEIAKGHILAYTDDDAVCGQDWLMNIERTYTDETIGAVGGKILPLWEEDPPEWIKTLPEVMIGLMDEGERFKEVHYVWGVNLSIRKKILFEVGGFNPDTVGGTIDNKNVIGDGESGLLDNVRKKGYKILYNPKIIVKHNIPKNRMTVSCMKSRYRNSGVVASYRSYREHKHNDFILFCRAGIFFILSFLQIMQFQLRSFFKQKQKFMAYFQSFYYLSRAFYELRIIKNKELQDLILKETWLLKCSDV